MDIINEPGREAQISNVLSEFIQNFKISFWGKDISNNYNKIRELTNPELYAILEMLEIDSFPIQLFIAIVSLMNYSEEDSEYLERSRAIVTPLKLLITEINSIISGNRFNLEIFHVIKTLSPEKYPAFLRDFGRILYRHGCAVPSEADFGDNPEFEDPFELRLSRKYDYRDQCAFTEEISNYWKDERSLINQYRTRFNSFPKNQKNKMKLEYWREMSGEYPRLEIDNRIPEFQFAIENLKSGDKANKIKDLIIFLSSHDPNGVNFPYVYKLISEGSPWKNEFIQLFQSNLAVRNYIYKSIKNGTALMSAFAITALALCSNGSQMKKKHFVELIDTLFQKDEDLNQEKYAAIVVNAAWLLQEPLVEVFIGRLLKMDFIDAKMDFERNVSEEEYKRQLISRIPIFKFFSSHFIIPERVRNEPDNLVQNTPKSLLSNFTLPSSFDPQKALEEIRTEKSWAPNSPRVLTGIQQITVLGYEFQIEPLPRSTAVDDWRVRIIFSSLEHGRLKNHEIILDFRSGVLSNHNVKKLSAYAKKNAELLGIFVAHCFFIRQKVNRETEVVAEKVENVIDDDVIEDNRNLDTGVIPSSTPRKKQPGFNVDLRESDIRDMEEKKKILLKRIIESEDNIKLALGGDFSDSVIGKIHIYRKVEGVVEDELYERCKPEDVRKIFSTRAFEDLYILEGFPQVPHLRDAGYMEFRRKSGIFGVRARKRTESADLKYMLHVESGMPELGEFTEFDSVINLILRDNYVGGEVNQTKIINNNGVEEEHLWESINPNETGLNAKLALKMRNKIWQKLWIESQRRVFEENLEWLKSQPDSLDLKVEVARVQDELERLEELSNMVSNNCRIRTYADGGKADVYLTMGWFRSEKTFNQGCFRPVSELLERIAGEHSEKEVREVVVV